ncbi:MAG: glycosyl hydrolase family 17 protein [Phycisphaerales bacterium JB040]
MRTALAVALLALVPLAACAQSPLQSEEHLLDDRVAAVCYSGFRAGQHPDRGDGANNPTRDQILQDLEIIRDQTPFRLLRLYDAQTNSRQVLELIDEHALPFTVMLGAWLSAEVSNPNCPWMPEPYPDDVLEANKAENAREIERAIALANRYPQIVTSVAVGNEALVDWNDHMVPLEQVISYVERVKDAVEQPVTVADNYHWWATQGAPLAAVVDFASVHTYPVWEGRSVGEGLSYTIENMLAVREALPGEPLVITEAGWATTASEFGDRASVEAQRRYYEELYAWASANNITTFFFEAFDEPWKGDPNNAMGAEKHWGLFYESREPKHPAGALDLP